MHFRILMSFTTKPYLEKYLFNVINHFIEQCTQKNQHYLHIYLLQKVLSIFCKWKSTIKTQFVSFKKNL